MSAAHAMTHWILAARPKTLPAALVPVTIGCSEAYRNGQFAWIPALLCVCFALLVQVGANFANDYYDFQKGADTRKRLGPKRAVASGIIRPAKMLLATYAVFIAAFLVGCGLIAYGGWWLLAIGIACILAGIAYTGGPYPLAYNGLGDVFVFLFFGVICVNFTYYVMSGEFTAVSLLASAGAGALINSLLVVNNVRDQRTDSAAGKRTLVVSFGRAFGLFQYRTQLVVASVVPLFIWIMGGVATALIAVLVFPFGQILYNRLATAVTADDYNRVLVGTSKMLLAYGVLLSLGLLVSR